MFAAPIPVDLARESATVDSRFTVENISTLSDNSTCSNQQQEDDDVATSATTSSVNHKITAGLSDGEVSVDSSRTNMDPVSQIHVSDNCESIPCQLKCDADCKKPEACETEPNYGHLDEHTNDSEDAGLLPDPNSSIENDLLYKDTEPVDLSRLGSALWPKKTLMSADCNFAALVAEHESYCTENAGSDTSHTALFSSCSGDSEAVHDDREALWPVVSRCLKESYEQSARELPRCLELIRGISASDEKLCINRNMSPPKLTKDDDKNTVNLTSISSQINSEPVSSLDCQATAISNDVSDNRLGDLGDESECSGHPPPPTFLSREEILSLQFNRVPLSPKVVSRIKELSLKRIDGSTLQQFDGKQVTRYSRMSKRPESNSGGITVLQAKSDLTENPGDSVGMNIACDNQLMNRCDVKPSAVLARGDATASSNTNDYAPITSSFELDRTDGKICPSTQQCETSESETRPISDISVDTLVAYTSHTRKPIDNYQLAKENLLKTCNTVDVPASNSVMLPSSVCATTAEVSAMTQSKCVASLAAKERLPTKKYDHSEVTGISETPVDISYYEDNVSHQPRQYIHQSEHSVTGRNARRKTDKRFTKERCHKSRKDPWYDEAFMYCPVDGEIDPQSRGESRCSKCSGRRNVKNNEAYDQTHRNAPYRQCHKSKHDRSSPLFDHCSYYRPYFVPSVTPSVLASISYSSYCLGAYSAHVQSMLYYNMLSQHATDNTWQQQADYIHKMAKYYAQK